MAKKENRRYINMECTVCKNRNYTTEKNFTNTVDKIEIKKYCQKCREHTIHKEIK